MSNIFPKEESAKSLIAHYWKDEFFCTIRNKTMVQIPSWFHSTFKDLSNKYSHAQIRVKTKKLWPRQVGEEKPVVVQKISRDQELGRDQKHVVTRNMSRPGNYVAISLLCRDQKCCINLKKAEK